MTELAKEAKAAGRAVAVPRRRRARKHRRDHEPLALVRRLPRPHRPDEVPRGRDRAGDLQAMIDGVVIKPLRQILDERGKVMHMLRCDAPEFETFGEIYFSVVLPGAIKAWHLHRRDDAQLRGARRTRQARPDRPSRGLYHERRPDGDLHRTGELPARPLPPNVWNGFKGIGTVPPRWWRTAPRSRAGRTRSPAGPVHEDHPVRLGAEARVGARRDAHRRPPRGRRPRRGALGLAASERLHRAGVDVLVVERERSAPAGSRAPGRSTASRSTRGRTSPSRSRRRSSGSSRPR